MSSDGIDSSLLERRLRPHVPAQSTNTHVHSARGDAHYKRAIQTGPQFFTPVKDPQLDFDQGYWVGRKPTKTPTSYMLPGLLLNFYIYWWWQVAQLRVS